MSINRPEKVAQDLINEALYGGARFDDILAHGVLHEIKALEHDLRRIKGFSKLLEEAIEDGDVDPERREENEIKAQESAEKIKNKLVQMRALLTGHMEMSGLEPFSNLEEE